ncbi:MAG: oligosaccharide flippase family protein [Nitrospina sp.]|jgi:O-antigen/teichoic acid export membrane protein|nr:oligosaccharide flippase family protein [Nitrospina sp.]MBT5968207.1 oligosaccharide flippase family protein [Nitrospina sp.]MBT6600973.1 oligosaccharide flippase family protein [Nitrospina sp.]
MRRFIRNNIIILAFFNSASVFNYLFQVVVGRSISTIDYGIFNSLFAMVSIFSAPVSILHIVFSRFIVNLSLSGMGKVKTLLVKSFKIMLVFSGVILLSGIVAIPLIKDFFHIEEATPILLLLATICFSLLFPIPFAILEGLHRFTRLGIGSGCSPLTRFLGALLFVTVLGWGVNGALLTASVASAFTLAFGIWSLKDILKSSSESLPDGMFRDMARYSGPVLIATTMTMVLGNIDISLVRHYCTPEEAGLYATAAILGRIALFLPSTLLTVLFPSIAKARELGEKDKYLLWTSLSLTAFLALAVVLLFNLWPEQLISLFLGDKHREAASLLKIISIAMGILSLANVIVSYSLARSNYDFLFPLVAGVILMIILILNYHDTATTIAYIMLLSVSSIFIIIFVQLFFKTINASTATQKRI